MKSHICGVQGECNDYCGGGQMANLRKQLADERATVAELRAQKDAEQAARIQAWRDAEAAEAKVAALEKPLGEQPSDPEQWQAWATRRILALSKDLARAQEALIAIRQGHESNEVDYVRDERIIGKALASISAPSAPSESAGKPPWCQCKKSDAWRCARDLNMTDRIACGCPCHAAGGKANG